MEAFVVKLLQGCGGLAQCVCPTTQGVCGFTRLAWSTTVNDIHDMPYRRARIAGGA